MYFAKFEITMTSPCGYVKFRSRADGMYYYAPVNEEEDEWLWGFSQKNGMIYRDTPFKAKKEEPAKSKPAKVVKREKPATDDSTLKVENYKQAMEWLVKNKGVKRNVYTEEEVLALAKKHGVEFPNLK